MRDNYVVYNLSDCGGRRSGVDRRHFDYSSHIPERRSGKDRRECAAEAIEEAGKIGEAATIAGAMRRSGSDRLAGERMESAGAVRTAATS